MMPRRAWKLITLSIGVFLVWSLFFGCSLKQSSIVTFTQSTVFVSSPSNPVYWSILNPCKDIGGVPCCSLSNISQWAFSSMGQGVEGYKSLAPGMCSYAGPLYFANALTQSIHYTNNHSLANFTYVDISCHILWWYSDVIKRNRNGEAANAIRNVMSRVLSFPNSQKYVIFLPHPSLVGVVDTCKPNFNLMTIVSERNQRCPNAMQTRNVENMSVIVPYNSFPPSPLDNAATRDLDLFFAGGTSEISDKNAPAGKRMRSLIVDQLTKLNDSRIHVQGTCGHCPRALGKDDMHALEQRSKYCLLPPGDQQSSQRLPEYVLAGCLPVFVFPPFHSMPLGDYVDYDSFAIFFRLRNSSVWLDPTSFAARHYQADVKVRSYIEVDSFAEIIPYLRAVLPGEYWKKKLHMSRYSKFFRYTALITEDFPIEPQTLEDTIINKLLRNLRS